MGPAIIDQLLKGNLISDPADLFFLKKQDLLNLERFAEKSADNLINSIQTKKRIFLSRFIYSLGIDGVGEETSALIAQESGIRNQESGIREILNYYQAISLEEWQEIEGIGPVMATSIFDWFSEKQNKIFLEKLDKAGVRIRNQESGIRNKKLNGKSFVLTGTLKNMAREIAKEKIREMGGDVVDSVSKNTNYLVLGENPGSKLEKAKILGVDILSEKDFLKMIG